MTTQEVYALPIGALVRHSNGSFILLLDRTYPEVIEDIDEMWSVPRYEIETQEMGKTFPRYYLPAGRCYTQFLEGAKRIA